VASACLVAGTDRILDRSIDIAERKCREQVAGDFAAPLLGL